MRKLLISILLASAAASPALAQDRGDHGDRGDRDRHHQQQSDNQEEREARQQAREQFRAQRQAERAEQPRAERPQIELRGHAFDRPAPQEANHHVLPDRRDVEQFHEARRNQRADGTSRWTRENIQQPGETARYVRDPAQRSGETSR
ncbi:MAG TPA: hypothetical protein VJT70_05020 [Sphingomicrobium sp.]|nr:hypothetical protein [Sphingomicrobium sp.]